MIQPERIKLLNSKQVRDGKYVLYWMQAAQRAEYNHALEYSIYTANKMKKPVLVRYNLLPVWPGVSANTTEPGLNDPFSARFDI